MMTDRELLELAAKAAGVEITRWNEMLAAYETNLGLWNALYNDGDALRLAASLGIHIAFYGDHIAVQQTKTKLITAQAKNGDMFSATRRAIVRAAAEIGRGME